jgi:hypothetical protein
VFEALSYQGMRPNDMGPKVWKALGECFINKTLSVVCLCVYVLCVCVLCVRVCVCVCVCVVCLYSVPNPATSGATGRWTSCRCVCVCVCVCVIDWRRRSQLLFSLDIPHTFEFFSKYLIRMRLHTLVKIL